MEVFYNGGLHVEVVYSGGFGTNLGELDPWGIFRHRSITFVTIWTKVKRICIENKVRNCECVIKHFKKYKSCPNL